VYEMHQRSKIKAKFSDLMLGTKITLRKKDLLPLAGETDPALSSSNRISNWQRQCSNRGFPGIRRRRVLPANDPRVQETLSAIEKTFLVDCEFVLRYEPDDGADGLAAGQERFWRAASAGFQLHPAGPLRRCAGCLVVR
jgi:hypothetical protein